jgi:acetyl esterase/lipase
MTPRPETVLALTLALAATSMMPLAAQRGGRGADTGAIKRKTLDLAYASASPAQKLDLYLPNDGDGPFPVIVHIHGGAFRSGDKADGQLTPVLQALERGYAVASINYRLSGEAIFPAQIHDVKAAIRWLRAHAKEHTLDPARFAAWGGSAGGHLASLAGTSGGVAALEDLAMGNGKQSSRVQAVVDWFGPINFLTMDEQFTKSGIGRADHNAAPSPESQLVGRQITTATDTVKAASPATYISPDDPPFFIQHGTKDPLVPTEQSIDFHGRLQAVLGKGGATLTLLEGAGHGGPLFSSPENMAKVLVFLDKILKDHTLR